MNVTNNHHDRRFRQKKPRGRGPVKFLDRQRKAQMIEAILVDYLSAVVQGYRISDIGSGNGA